MKGVYSKTSTDTNTVNMTSSKGRATKKTKQIRAMKWVTLGLSYVAVSIYYNRHDIRL